MHVLELTDNQLCYTDILHQYGCIPSHLNIDAYDNLAQQLKVILERKSR